MTAPAFEFTTRAAPIVQFGRPERPSGDAHWDSGEWGTGHWGNADWEPLIWTDLTCEIHEIRTVTGRGSASDRFVPGTGHIVASNVHDVADMIFPHVPGVPAHDMEFVPQPPIQLEETLQAPDAATVVSNGWSFTDDFHTLPPRWVFPQAFAETGTYPTRPMVWGAGHVTPEVYSDLTGSALLQAHGAMQWSGPHPYPDTVVIGVEVGNVDWGGTPSAGTPSVVVELYAYGNTVDRACNCARFTFTPVFSGGNNTCTIDQFRMAADGSVVDNVNWSISSGLGVNGQFGVLTLVASFFPASNSAGTSVNGITSSTWTVDADWFATDSRAGVGVHWVEGNVAGTTPGPPAVTRFTTSDVDDDFTRPPGSGWKTYPRHSGPMIVEGGSMHPPVEYKPAALHGGYRAVGSAQWVSDFDGDQFIEAAVGDLSMPSPITGTITTFLTLFAKGNSRDQRSVVARINYDFQWGATHNFIYWLLVQYGPNGEFEYDPDLEDVSYGTIDVGATAGIFPDPSRWRLEADTAGEVRLYYQGELLGAPMFPNLPDGGRVGLYLNWETGWPSSTGQARPTPARIDQVWAGLREPLGTEELGIWIRIGVHHAILGNQWFLRGCVDGCTPTYVPDRPDAVRIECIDTLGEAGRVRIIGDQLPHEFAPAPTRIHQILNHAHWPRNLRIIHDDATVMSRPASGKAVDALTHVAESCGGAIWSEPRNGNIVFKGQDWQGEVAAGPSIALITNARPDDDTLTVPRVCPTGWEQSAHREDMNTRVRYSSVSSQGEEREPLVREWRAPKAEAVYGVELYERTVLCVNPDRLGDLARRQLRLRHPNQFPRVEAVLLDAATADEALDLMTTADWTIPSKYRCQLRRPGEYVFNRAYLVTGIQHTMTPERWTCRLALDLAVALAETGGRWDEARWQTPGDTWGRSR